MALPTVLEVDWQAVYEEQLPRLYNFFRYRTGDSDLAQDLCSQTLMKAWRYRHSYRHDLGAFEAWLFQIARNVVRDALQARQTAPLPLSEDLELVAETTIEAELQQRQDAQKLYRLLQDLPAKEQELIALKYGADLTNRAIAKIVQLSESNVGTILSRTIQKLRTRWGV